MARARELRGILEFEEAPRNLSRQSDEAV